ncbi:MAG TPA: TonB-dependent receptor [Gemmatimonadaceae bacterium]
MPALPPVPMPRPAPARNRLTRRCATVLAILALVTAGRVDAQRPGAIAGRVTDDAGAPVPAATIALASADSAITRLDLTGADGRFRIGLLPPGRYQLTMRRLGFRPLVRAGVVVRPGEATAVELRADRAATTLDAIVIGAAPNELRRDDTRSGMTVDEIELAALPVGYDVNSIVAFTPGARPDQLWGGATEQANSYVVDGVALNHPGLGGALLPLNPSWLQELEVTGLGAGAQFGNFQGGLVRAVTKRGSNTRAGWLRASGETRALNGTNVGVSETASELTARRDVEGELRGPIVRDRLFYYASAQALQRESRALDHLHGPLTDRAFLAHRGEHREQKLFAKLTWQATPHDEVELSAARVSVSAEQYGQTGFESADAGLRLRAPTTLANLGWRRTLGSSASLDVRVAHARSEERRDPYAGPDVPGVVAREIGGDRAFQNAAFRSVAAPRSTVLAAQLDGSLTLAGARHFLSGGVDLSAARHRRTQLRNGGMTWRPSIGSPPEYPQEPPGWYGTAGIVPLNVGGEVRLDADLTNGAAFVEDRVEFGPRLSLVAGARQGWWRGALRPASGAARIEAVRDAALEPRLGLIVDPAGRGNTVARLHWGRYHQYLFAQFFDRVQGAGVFTNEQLWYYYGTVADARRGFSAATRDSLAAAGTLRLVQEQVLNEEGKVSGYRQPWMDQFVASVAQRLGTRWSAEVTYINRRNRGLVALVDRNLATNYTRVENVLVVDRFDRPILDADGRPLMLREVYLPNNSLALGVQTAAATPGHPPVPNFRTGDLARLTWDPDYAITAAPGAQRDFESAQLRVTGRLPLATITGSLAFSRLVGNVYSVTGYDDPAGRGAGPWVHPNEAIDAFGRLPDVNEMEAKLRVSGGLPWKLRGGAFFTAVTGERYSATYTHDAFVYDLAVRDPLTSPDTVRFAPVIVAPLVGQRVFLEPRGSRIYPTRLLLDLHLERSVPLVRSELVVLADAFNVLGESGVIEANTTVDALTDPNASGPFGSAREGTPPRTVRLGVALRF